MERMMECSPGVIAMQTLAGAIATGTNGQGLGQSSIADAAVRIRMVGADGFVRVFEQDDPSFGAVQLALGSLGVVSQITVRTTTSRVSTCLKRAESASDLQEGLPYWLSKFPLCKIWWFPENNQLHVWLGREATEIEESAYRASGSRLLELSRSNDELNGTVDQTLAQMRLDTKDLIQEGSQFKTLTRFKDFADVTGEIHQISCKGIAVPQVNLEIAVPLRRVEEAIDAIRAWHEVNRPPLHYPIIMRCTGASTAWLSPAYGEAVCYFGFVVYYAIDGTISQEGLKFLNEVQILLASHDGRPHWGKHFNQSLYDWASLYPRWHDFCHVRRQLDPEGKFANEFARGLFEHPAEESGVAQ
jgi:FAD/FMN-containing dehydrogenase